MLKIVCILVLVVGLCRSEDRTPCRSHEDCGRVKCPGSKVCLAEKCYCFKLGKRSPFQKILEGACLSTEECRDRCQPTGLVFGRCLLDRCLCYTLP